MNHIQKLLTLIGLSLIVTAGLSACHRPMEPGKVIIVRHAEKGPGGGNVNLRTDGLTRASDLADLLADDALTAVYATNYCRTAHTGQPTAVAHDLPLQIRMEFPGGGLGGCVPPITAPQELLTPAQSTTAMFAERLAATESGATVLVVGHSNTVPDVIEELVGESICPDIIPGPASNCLIPENEFNHLFEVTIPANGDDPSVTHTTYGAPSP